MKFRWLTPVTGRIAIVLGIVLGVLLVSGPVGSQTIDQAPESTAEAEPASAEPVATTAADPEIGIRRLELLLRPLSREDLVVEADAWQQLVKESAQALVAAQLRRLEQPGDANVATEIEQRRIELEARAERMREVLAALAARGGDRAPYDQYLGAAVGGGPGVDDAGRWIGALENWLIDPDRGLRFLKNIILALITLLVFRILAAFTARVVGRALKTARPDTSQLLRDFFTGTTRKIVFVLGIIVALSMLEVQVGPFLAAIGVAGFVIGFALQETLSNFAAGLMILLYRPYEVGNYINAAGVAGTVEAMTLVSTTLKTPDNQRVVVPNGSIWGGVITNVTGNPTRRVDFVFGIGYGDDIQKARQVLLEIVKAQPEVLEAPEPVVELHELADSSVNFVCRPWVKTGDYWSVYWAVTRKVKERFDAEGISIPFPQRDVHLHQVNEA